MSAGLTGCLVLFSGLGADETVFRPQKEAFPDLVTPQWQQPLPHESLTDYCERWAANLRPLQPRFLGGASFGGLIAQEIARILRPEAVFLIGSARADRPLPQRIRALRPLAGGVAWLPVRGLQRLVRLGVATMPMGRASAFSEITRQFARSDPALLRWSARQILEWRPRPALECPVYQIHGAADWIFPLRTATPDAIVAGGGHVISLTHGAAVNEFLREHLM